MSHKAYSFDWSRFECDELHGALWEALTTGDSAGLIRYIEAHRADVKDPYAGEPPGEDWQEMLENRDVHEYGDFALTRFYDPAEDCGLWDQWRDLDERLPQADRTALLGVPFGPPDAYFDPGRLGSYFQTPRQVVQSLARVRQVRLPDMEEHERESLQQFEDLLAECAELRFGIYVTF
jgi:hypothetical protein